MEASFARQNLLQKVQQLQATKNWSGFRTPDGRVDIGALINK